MMDYFEKLAQDAYTLASKYGNENELNKIQQEEDKIRFLHQQNEEITYYLKEKEIERNSPPKPSVEEIKKQQIKQHARQKVISANKKFEDLYKDAKMRKMRIQRNDREKCMKEAQTLRDKPKINGLSKKIVF